jgi:hypothetical protein
MSRSPSKPSVGGDRAARRAACASIPAKRIATGIAPVCHWFRRRFGRTRNNDTVTELAVFRRVMSRHGRLRWTSPLAGALLGVALLAAASGGGSASPTVASLGSTTTTAAASAAPGESSSAIYSEVLAYSGCIRANGVPNFPDPNSQGIISSGLGSSTPQFGSANKVCSHLLPNGGQHTAAEVVSFVDRGRDRPCGRPPAQIPASGIPALGSCLRSGRRSALPDEDARCGQEGAMFG